jgi:hypothetical protein
MLYVNLQEFFENRYATFKNSDFMIGGILKENNNFLLIFQYLSENKFMNEFRINSINLSQYHFLEDIMTDIDEFNSKRVVHNIEKKDFKIKINNSLSLSFESVPDASWMADFVKSLGVANASA